MKTFKNIEEVNLELKRLNLERQIAWEQLKGLKEEIRHDLRPYNWLSTLLSALRKYGIFYLMRKLFR